MDTVLIVSISMSVLLVFALFFLKRWAKKTLEELNCRLGKAQSEGLIRCLHTMKEVNVDGVPPLMLLDFHMRLLLLGRDLEVFGHVDSDVYEKDLEFFNQVLEVASGKSPKDSDLDIYTVEVGNQINKLFGEDSDGSKS